MLKNLIITIVVLGAAAVCGGLVLNLRTPPDLYLKTGQFAGCPSWTACVSSIAPDDQHRVPALGFAGDPSTAYAMLHEVVERIGGKVEHEAPGYLHAVFLSPKLGLREDVELLVEPDGRVDVRSASRVDARDPNVNRSRIEELRRNFEAQP